MANIIDRIVKKVMLKEKYSLAFSLSFFPKLVDIKVDEPIENKTDNPNIIFTNGVTIFTEAKAVVPTPLLTNIPSTIIYNADTHIESTDGIIYLKKSFFSLERFIELILT